MLVKRSVPVTPPATAHCLRSFAESELADRLGARADSGRRGALPRRRARDGVPLQLDSRPAEALWSAWIPLGRALSPALARGSKGHQRRWGSLAHRVSGKEGRGHP